MTLDKRQYLYYLIDSTSTIFNDQIRDILYSGIDYNETALHAGISLYYKEKEKPMTLNIFIRDMKINLLIN